MRTMMALPRLSDLPDVNLQTGAFLLLAGPKASEKSSLLNAITLLGNLLQVVPSTALLGGRRPVVRSRVADPPQCCIPQGATSFELTVQLIPSAGLSLDTHDRNRYSVDIASDTDKNKPTIVNPNLPSTVCNMYPTYLRL